jgi:transcriptional regulator of acetoin/glycerol metabolism
LAAAGTPSAPARPSRVLVPYAQAEAEFEKQTLKEALAASNGQIAEAAKILRISRSTFYKKLAKFGLAQPDSPLRVSRQDAS